MSTVVSLQVLRKGTPYTSYRITLPKSVIESKGWEKSRFKLELKGDAIVLKPVRDDYHEEKIHRNCTTGVFN